MAKVWISFPHIKKKPVNNRIEKIEFKLTDQRLFESISKVLDFFINLIVESLRR